MYTPGTLIFFDPFFFKNGNPGKAKFFLVLKATADNVIVACLPSSVNHLPLTQPLTHGCLEIPASAINCYIIKANTPVTTTGWCFDADTLLYGWWIDDFTLNELNARYSIKDIDYKIIGQLNEAEFKNIIHCFASSSVVKRKYKRLLTT